MGVQFAGNILVQSNGGPLPISMGGTGQTTAATAIAALLPSQSNQAGKALVTNGTSLSWSAVTASAAGSDTQIQYNDGGSFGGSSSLTINKSTGALTSTSTFTGTGVNASGAAGTTRSVKFQTAGSDRWILSADSSTESGALAGSNLALTRVSDNGATTNSVFTVSRATGVVDFKVAPTVNGSAIGGGGGVTSFNTRTGDVTLSSTDVTDALGFTPTGSITSSANQVIFNNAGTLAGSSEFLWYGSSNTLAIGDYTSGATITGTTGAGLGIGAAPSLTVVPMSSNTGNGGDLVLTGGETSGSTYTGGNVTITGGAGTATSTTGGSVNISSGAAPTNGTVSISTGSTQRLRVLANGAWSVGTNNTSYGTSGQVLTSNGNAAPTWATPTAAATPGGSNTQLQYNNNGSLAGTSAVTYNSTTGVVTAAGLEFWTNATIATANSSSGKAKDINIQGGSSTYALNTSGSGSGIYLYAGDGTNQTQGGDVFTYASAGTQFGGTIAMYAGDGTSTRGGDVLMMPGYSSNTNGAVKVWLQPSSNPSTTKSKFTISDGNSSTEFFTVNTTGEVKFNNSAGTSGQVLTSAGAGAPPTWSTPASGAAAAGTLTGTTLASNVVSSSLTSVGTLTSLAVTGTITTGGLEVGTKIMPQNANPGASYTLVLADSGKHIYTTTASQAYTIPAASSVAYPIGTALTFVNTGSGTCTVAITSDTMYLAGSAGTTGTRTVGAYGVATAIKVAGASSAGVWIISGTNLS